VSSMRGSLSFLNVFGENLVVVGSELLGLLETLNLSLLGELLSSESFLSDESLNLGALIECLITLLDFTTNNVLSHIVLFAESKYFTNCAGSLRSLSAWLGISGNSINISITLLDDAESDNSEIRSTNAATD